MSVRSPLPVTLTVGPLPENPLEAAATFHVAILPRALELSDASWQAGVDARSHVTLLFEPAGYPHRAWREAALQTLARECAPIRINALAGPEMPGMAAAVAWLAAAPGVTGQFLTLDSQGAGPVVNSES